MPERSDEMKKEPIFDSRSRKIQKPQFFPALALAAVFWLGLSGCAGEPTPWQEAETGSSEAAMTLPDIDKDVPDEFETASFGLG